MWATWRSRSVGSRVTPRASAMSWVCAQVSMIRAVSDDATLMAGPNHGSRARGSRFRNVFKRSPRAVSNQSSSWEPLRSRNRTAIASGLMPPLASASARSALNCSGRSADWTVTSSKYARWLIWSAMSQPAAGVGVCHPASSSPATSARVTADSAARSAASAVMSAGTSLFSRFEYRKDLAGADLLPRLGPEFGQHAAGGRADGLLHLHRLQHQDRLARGDYRAGFGQHPQDQAGHRGQQRPGGRQLGRIAEPRGLGQRGRAVAGVDVGVGADAVNPVDPPGA